MSNEKLEQLRSQINALDDNLLQILTQRAELALATSQHKRELAGIADGVCDPKRESQVVARILEQNQDGKLKDAAVAHIFQTIIHECRELQRQSPDVAQAVMQISLQGDRGSFSESAANQFAVKRLREKYELRYDLTPSGVISALATGAATYGVLAVSNAWGGLVNDSINALAAHRHRIIDIIPMPVRQCLLVHPDQDLQQLQHIVSHPQALRQCRRYLDEHYPDCDRIEYDDTALAAKDCAAGELPENSAAIGSEACLEHYELQLVERGIQDLADNDTLFVIIRCQES